MKKHYGNSAVRKIFDLYDKNKDGKIRIDELSEK